MQATENVEELLELLVHTLSLAVNLGMMSCGEVLRNT